MKHSVSVSRLVVTALSASLCAVPLQAREGGSLTALSDLAYQDMGYVQNQLGARGYVYVDADQQGSKKWQFWWLAREHECIRVTYVNNKADSVVETLPTDCNQQPSADPSKDRGMSTGAKVAIGAAALLGVAMLAHRSHERDEKKHKSEQQIADFDRGYRDGLYHQSFHDYDRSASYVDGYNAGQQKREAETPYRSNRGHHSGHAAYIQVSDLVGARGSSASEELKRRGFVAMGGYKQGGSSFTTWWNARTRQCLQVITNDGRIRSLETIVEGNCL